jgi:hypothetical protein
MSLGNLGKYFDKTHKGDFHDAKVDTEMTVEILESMRERVKAHNPNNSNKKRRLE